MRKVNNLSYLKQPRSAYIGIIITMTSMVASEAFANESITTDIPQAWGVAETNSARSDSEKPPSALSSKISTNKSYAIPALEIVGFDTLLNQFNRHFSGSSDYDSNLSTMRSNLRHSWVIDNDPFQVNQFLHPYQGSMYHGFARSAGLNYWQSAAYTFGGSAFWEIAGEKTPPSKNDQVASGIAGSFLGEALFRISNLVLEKATTMPSIWREISAAVISPSTGFNRLAFGDRFNTIFPSHDPNYFASFDIGSSKTVQNYPGESEKLKRNETLANISLDYGLPNKSGYTYTRPFDYFNLQASASSANGFENIMTRGLLIGKDYEAGDNYRGVWGIYGNYDYIAPQIFRISSTAVSFGTTAEWWPGDSIAVQGTGLMGLGYAATGGLHSNNDRDYHYGPSPQALLALRFILGNRVALDLTAREYFVSGATSAKGGNENIARADAEMIFRIHRQHAVSIKYLWSHRNASFSGFDNIAQTRSTIGLYYTAVNQEEFGAVNWHR